MEFCLIRRRNEVQASILNDSFSGFRVLISVRILKSPFYVCADRYVICADLFLRMRGKFTLNCAVFNYFYR